MKIKVGDRVRPVRLGDEREIARSTRAMRVQALLGRVQELLTPSCRGEEEDPRAYVRWNDGTSGSWPIALLERLPDVGHGACPVAN